MVTPGEGALEHYGGGEEPYGRRRSPGALYEGEEELLKMRCSTTKAQAGGRGMRRPKVASADLNCMYK
jgi:hypothetical protein